jgi:hypothetical protein
MRSIFVAQNMSETNVGRSGGNVRQLSWRIAEALT